MRKNVGRLSEGKSGLVRQLNIHCKGIGNRYKKINGQIITLICWHPKEKKEAAAMSTLTS